MYKGGVDLIFEAHEHRSVTIIKPEMCPALPLICFTCIVCSYERLWPVYNLTVTAFDYVDPIAPVHIITGAAGCNEDDGGACGVVVLFRLLL